METPKTLRAARKYLYTVEGPKAIEEVNSWGLHPQEELFLWYGDDPAAFVRDMFTWEEGDGPTFYQIEAMDALVKTGRASVRGPHGLGKTSLAAWFVLWFGGTRDGIVDWKCVTTASAWRQLVKFLWPEIKKWISRMKWNVLQRDPYKRNEEMMSHALKLTTGEAFAAASDDPALIEGAHADHMLYIFDEAKRIKPSIFDAAEGAFSGAGPETDNEAYGFAGSTPGPPSGPFHDIQTNRPGYEDWWARHVTLEEVIKVGRVSEQWAKQRERQWGRESAIYINRVLGDFASSDESSVIPLSWIEAAQDRWGDRAFTKKDTIPIFYGTRDTHPPLDAVGVDVAYSGSDKTAIAFRHGTIIRHISRLPFTPNTVEQARIIKQMIDTLGSPTHPPTAIVDSIGYGAGVKDDLAEIMVGVEAYVGSHKTFVRDRSGELRFKNKRSAAYWNMRELLDPIMGENIALPPDEENLVADLVTPTWREMEGGVIQVEAKEKVKERLGRSPDDGDAVVMAFWQERTAPRPIPQVVSIRKEG